jgi:hypothetical protein
VKLRDELQQAHRDLGQVNIELAKAKARVEYLNGMCSHCFVMFQSF